MNIRSRFFSEVDAQKYAKSGALRLQARAAIPGVGRASRAAMSVSESALVEKRTFPRVSSACAWRRHASVAQRRTLANAHVVDRDPGAIVDAESERRGVLHVSGLADDDVHVRIGVAGAPVVNLQ